MNITTKFNMLQKVRIIEINVPATVQNIKIDGLGIIYDLEYWWNGEVKAVYLYEHELDFISDKERLMYQRGATIEEIRSHSINNPDYKKAYINLVDEVIRMRECADDKISSDGDRRKAGQNFWIGSLSIMDELLEWIRKNEPQKTS